MHVYTYPGIIRLLTLDLRGEKNTFLKLCKELADV